MVTKDEPTSGEKEERKVPVKGRRNRLLLLILIWTLIAVVFLGMTISTRIMTHNALLKHQQMTQGRLRSLTFANQLIDASDSLTAQLWRFGITGELDRGYSYLDWVKECNLHTEDFMELYTEGLCEEELYYLKQAKLVSDELLVKEKWAARLLFEAEGVENLPSELESVELSPNEQALSKKAKKELAREYLFGELYARRKLEFKQNIQEFQESQRNMIGFEQLSSNAEVERQLDLNMMMGLLILSWLLMLQFGIYHVLIRPVWNYSQSLLKQSAEGVDYAPLDLQGSYETKNLGHAFNHVLSQLQEAKKQLQRQNEELMVLSKTDHLTKVLNRLAMENYMETLLEEYRGTNWPIGIIMLDLDYFKKFNDSYGHPAGDDALCHVAGILSELVDKNGGIISRMGGEEFFILYPGQGEQEIDLLAEELLIAVRQAKITVGGSIQKNLTISVGSYVYCGGTESLKMIYTYADNALYAAKKQGRNCHVTYASLKEKKKESEVPQ